MPQYSIGLDYGTSSCRAVIVDLSDGSEVAEAVSSYPSGVGGVTMSEDQPDLARQEPSEMAWTHRAEFIRACGGTRLDDVRGLR